MTQKNEVLTREDDRISLVSRTRTATLEGCLNMTERVIPVDTLEETRMFEVREKTPVGRTTPKLGSFLVDITKWLYYLGTGEVDDSRPASRYPVDHNFRIKGMPWELL